MYAPTCKKAIWDCCFKYVLNWLPKILLEIFSSDSLFCMTQCLHAERFISFVPGTFSLVSQSVPAASLQLSKGNTISLFLQAHPQPSSADQPTASTVSHPRLPASHLPPTLPNRWQEERSIIASGKCHVHRPSWRSARRLRVCLRQPLCQGSWVCQLLHCRSAAAADATHLQVNVFYCAGE